MSCPRLCFSCPVSTATPAASEALMANVAWVASRLATLSAAQRWTGPDPASAHDVHRLFPGVPVVLGGVEFPSWVGFNTHSDGDVLCYALIDALAGTILDGDLGPRSPRTTPTPRTPAALSSYASSRAMSAGPATSWSTRWNQTWVEIMPVLALAVPSVRRTVVAGAWPAWSPAALPEGAGFFAAHA